LEAVTESWRYNLSKGRALSARGIKNRRIHRVRLSAGEMPDLMIHSALLGHKKHQQEA
jgi:hypothetical protein